MAWKKTGVGESTLTPGTMVEANLDGGTVLLARIGASVYAMDGICSHQGGILSQGTLEDRRVQCPEHGATFDVTSGIVLVDPDGVEPPQGVASPLKTYPTRVEHGVVEVDL